MTNSGGSKREVVENLIEDIATFIEIVEEEIGEIKRDANSLSDAWDDKQYEDFLEYVEDLSKQLGQDLADLENVNYNLKKALEQY